MDRNKSRSEVLRTFAEWSEAGYKIIKGSKAIWVDGIPKFSRKQVERYHGWMYADYNNEEFEKHWDWGIDPWG